MTLTTTRGILLAAAAWFASVTLAGAETWRIADGSEVVFRSEAPMESFEGKTDQVSGTIVCDPGDLSAPAGLRLEVDLASLDTGIGLRNQHMRDRHLETDEYPLAVFEADEIVRASTGVLIDGQAVEVVVRGSFDLHGVTRPLEVTARVVLTNEGGLEVSTEFPVSLEAHAIDRPQFLVMKLADEQQVRVHLLASREEP